MSATQAAYLFPGQGSQKVGMGAAWVERSRAARAVFEVADETLGFPLSRLCREGPEEELQLTANTQPAILATSVAIHRALGSEVPPPVAMAGHSLGEYSALVAAGAIDLEDALRLVRRRGELMQEAVPVGIGAMAAVLGLEAEGVEEVVREASREEEVCAVANLNAPGQTVIAGHRPAVERASALAKERGAKRAVLLPVSAPFHSPLMAPAREGMAPLLEAVSFSDPSVPVLCNVDAAPVTRAEDARNALERQIDSPVRWVESVRRMAEEMGVSLFLEVGSGGVLTGLNRRIVPDATTVSLSEPDGLAKLRESR